MNERMGDGLGGRERDILGLKRCPWGQQGWTRTGGSVGSEVETCWASARVKVRHVGPASSPSSLCIPPSTPPFLIRFSARGSHVGQVLLQHSRCWRRVFQVAGGGQAVGFYQANLDSV